MAKRIDGYRWLAMVSGCWLARSNGWLSRMDGLESWWQLHVLRELHSVPIHQPLYFIINLTNKYVFSNIFCILFLLKLLGMRCV